MQTRRIDISSGKETERWDAFVARERRAYHLSAWAGILSASFGFEPHYLCQEQDGEIASVFPLARVRLPGVRDELVSLPHVESAGILNPDHYQRYFDFIKESLGVRSILIYQGRSALADLAANSSQALFHLDLPDDPQTMLVRGPSEVIRKGMKKAIAKEYSVSFGNNPSLRKDFYGAYLRKMKEFGTPPQGFRYMNNVADAFGDGCVIAVVRDGDRILGASLDLLYRDHLYKLYFAVTRHHLNDKVGYLLEYKSLEHAIMNGARHVVLGRSEKGSGAFQYKERLGGHPLPLNIYTLKRSLSGYNAVPSETVKERFAFAAQLWQRLPLRLTALLGPPLRKYLY